MRGVVRQVAASVGGRWRNRGKRPRTVDPRAREVVALIEAEDVLDAWALATPGTLAGLTRGELLRLCRGLRKRGYLAHALTVATVLDERFQDARDATLRAHVAGELAVLGGTVEVTVEVPERRAPVPGRVLHIVGASVPEHQSGYALRTHYTAQAQLAAGLEPHVVTQMGFGEATEYSTVEVDGVVYHRCPGAARGSGALDKWFAQNVRRVDHVVRTVRPTVLHAASDLINAQVALIVGRAHGIPVVYESRGFWEETWLQREAEIYGWTDLPALAEHHGLPDVYLLRRATEDRCRREADAVVTLAAVMADRIVEGGVDRSAVTVVPNGVDADRFPVVGRDEDLARTLGLSPDGIVVGYVSSLVDYEGVDVLVRAVARLRTEVPGLRLLVVGDGPEREKLAALARDCGLDDAIFTGRVPHDAVLDYYGLIDLFVVPRRPVSVCHLVTPLKPFEAMACGRTLVMSDVLALREIATDSGAAELFTAGDPDSLARVLRGLVDRPEERARLAAIGAEWVRRERTWAGNIDSYLAVYESLGAVPPGTRDMATVSPTEPDTATLTRWVRDHPVAFGSSIDVDDRDADRILADGWEFPPHPAVRLDAPIDWDRQCTENRSWAFRLHAWDFMGPVLRAYETSGDRRYLDWCRDRAVSWALRFTEGSAGDTMAWYDMSLGLRAPRLAFLLTELLRLDDRPAVEVLRAAVVRHQRELFRSEAFTPTTNHGYYTAIGQLMFARRLAVLPGMAAMEAQALDRLARVVHAQFAADGGHLEHSTDYHRMLLGSFSTALEAGLVEDPDLAERVALASEVLGWMVEPGGCLVQIGDSPQRDMRSTDPVVTSVSATTEFVLSGGVRGTPPTDAVRVLPESGYVFVRHPAPRMAADLATASYLTLMAGFHSRTHKHADDLSFTWFDRGREIVVDAGRYGYLGVLAKDAPERLEGYFYGAPERQFVESTRAHNTVEADGRDHLRRGREPYGSAVVDAEERDGHVRVRGRVDHGTWTHERSLVLRPGRWLLVEDRLTGRHDFRSWTNLPEDLAPVVVDPQALRVDIDAEDLWIVALGDGAVIPPVSAQAEPLRGWRSRQDGELTPSWSTGFEVPAEDGATTFRTLYHFGSTRPESVPDHPFDSPEVP